MAVALRLPDSKAHEIRYNASMTAAAPQPRWYCLTPDRIVIGLLVVECLLWVSERFQWFGFNTHKGWTVLIAVASMGVAFLVTLLWFIVSLFFRWRFQFSIRSLLVLVVVVALPCSWFAVEMRAATRQKDVVMAIQRAGGAVFYEHQFDSSGNQIPVGGVIWDNPVDENGNPIPGGEAPGAESPAPTWLRRLLGDDFFRAAIEVSVANEEGLTHVRLLAGIKRLRIDAYSRYTLQRFAPVPDSIPLTNSGLRFLDDLPELQEVAIIQANGHITEAGLRHLGGLKQLRKLKLLGVGISDEGVTTLQQALPNCRIEHLFD